MEFHVFSLVVSFGVWFFWVSGYTGYTMASLYKRVGSPYWWIKYFNDTGKRVQESTGLLHDSVAQTREARKLRASKEMEECRAPRSDRSPRAFSVWVIPWLTSQNKNDGTLESYLGAWKNLLSFFTKQEIRSASEVKREHCFAYLDWRIAQGVCRNTAIHDLRILRKILFEAYNREWIDRNPASKLGIERDTPERKPVISDADRAKVEASFPKKTDWREICWTIAINQGCRLAETSLPISDVDFDHDLITFTLKGGRRHTTKLMPEVKKLLLKLKADGATRTWEFHRLASRDWSRIFERLGCNFSFHSTRVTVITKLARAGVNEQMARRFIGHASSEIHAIYTRLEAGDLDCCVDALTVPSAPLTSPTLERPLKGKPGKAGTRRQKARIGRPAMPRRV
jgi:site-specific recombinase XerD